LKIRQGLSKTMIAFTSYEHLFMIVMGEIAGAAGHYISYLHHPQKIRDNTLPVRMGLSQGVVFVRRVSANGRNHLYSSESEIKRLYRYNLITQHPSWGGKRIR